MTFPALPTIPAEVLTWNYYLDSRGYFQFTSGPHRKRRVHRVLMEIALGRPLRRDEHVHHRDEVKVNNAWGRDGEWNLEVMGEREHNCVSAKQAWYVKTFVVPREKAEWEEMHGVVDDNVEGDVTFP